MNSQNANDSATVMRLLKGLQGVGVFEIYEKIMTFECYSNKPNGEIQEVTVEILDGGPDVPSGLRYFCKATASGGATASGNPGSSIEEAVLIVHWNELDRK